MLKAHILKQRREMQVDVAFELERGASLGLFGTSGAGKSTVLACLSGLEEPDGGSVEFAGERFFAPSMPLHRRRVGLLTQEPGLFPHLRVRENVNFGIAKEVADSAEHLRWIGELRKHLHLDPLWNAWATALSGGQARRVSLARMLARKPRLVLLDEPFSGLDRQLTRELIDSLVHWNRQLRFTMIAVDHQAEVLRRLCPEQVVVLERGRIVQRGSWESLYRAPGTPLLRALLAPL